MSLLLTKDKNHFSVMNAMKVLFTSNHMTPTYENTRVYILSVRFAQNPSRMLGIWRNICVGTLRCKNQKNKTDWVSQWKNAIIIPNYYRQQERVIAGRYTVCTLSTSSFKAVRVLLKVALGIPVPHLPHHSRLRRRVSQEDYACFCLLPIMDPLSLHHPNHWFQRAFHVCGLPRPFARRFGQTRQKYF